MATQNQALLAYMKKHPKGITTYVAFEMLGITSLAKRICELEKNGVCIDRNKILGTNRYGNPCQVTRYRLNNS